MGFKLFRGAGWVRGIHSESVFCNQNAKSLRAGSTKDCQVVLCRRIRQATIDSRFVRADFSNSKHKNFTAVGRLSGGIIGFLVCALDALKLLILGREERWQPKLMPLKGQLAILFII